MTERGQKEPLMKLNKVIMKKPLGCEVSASLILTSQFKLLLQ